jgi:hypothetical protein
MFGAGRSVISGGTAMGFWNGRVTYTRFQVSGEKPLPFDDQILELAGKHLIGVHASAVSTDPVSTGWSGGDHVLDLSLEREKNIVDDALHLAIRIDSDKIPGSLLRAYTQMEIDARAVTTPSGIANKAQRQEAKEAALLRAQTEAADGRFRRLAHYPILWEGRTNTLYAGSTSGSVLERIQGLFRETFDRTLEPMTAGSLAQTLAPLESGGATDFLSPTAETAGDGSSDGEFSALDVLGSELLVWVWHSLQHDGGTRQLLDGSEASVVLARTLTLDCPRGETGRDHLTDELPTRLPEALRALQAGKLPRKAGMILARQGAQYELTLQADTLSVSGAMLPKPEGPKLSPYEARIARLESLRHLSETLDLLFATYLARRASASWTDELGLIRNWLRPAA